MRPGTGMTTLDAVRLGAALRAGVRRVVANQERLNRINVFPVPDGDTGTNLTLTLSAVLSALGVEENHAGTLLARVADAAIDGARGTSGAILAQFFVGFADRAGTLPELTTRDFAAALESGAIYARESLSEPREGTLLTVLTDVASEASILVRDRAIHDFAVLLPLALERARASLDATRNQLEELRRADVVDAGALGFVELAQGMSDFLTGAAADVPQPATRDSERETVGEEIDPAHRFCTECVIAAKDIDRRRLREALAGLGSSVVVAGTRDKAKVHVHVNDPAELFRVAARFGSVSARKADDIRKQQDAAHHRHGHAVAVVVDSAADIPEEQIEQLGIHMIPMRVHFGERSYLDKVSLPEEDFYRELATNPVHPKTSQPPPGDFRRAFEFLASHYETVISINLTARVSGTLAAAQSAASRVQAAGRVVVIDSLNASLGQGLVAMYAAECARAGNRGESVVAAVRAIIPRTFTFGLLGRLDFAVRGGRVPRIVKTLADLLHATPILINQRNGRVGAGTALFGRSNLPARFARLVRRRLEPGRRYRIAVGHAHAENEGRELLEQICHGLDNIHARYLTTLGAALGVHGGPGMLVVGVQDYLPPPAGFAGAEHGVRA